MDQPGRLNTGAKVQVRGKLNVAVSLCGGTESILDSISNQNPGLDAIVIAEAGPNLLIAEEASHLFGSGRRDLPESQQEEFTKRVEEIEELYRHVRSGRAKKKEIKSLEYQLQHAREEAVKAAAELNQKRLKIGAKEIKVHFVFDEPRTGKEQYTSRQFQVSSPSAEAKRIVAIVGENREDDLIRIANTLESLGNFSNPPNILISDFLFGKSGTEYDARPENLKPSQIPNGREMKFHGDSSQKRKVEENLFSKVNVFISPGYTVAGPESREIVKKTHGDGYYLVVNAGPCIEEELSEISRELTNEVHFGSYALLVLDDRDAWVAYKRKLRNARFKLKRKFNNYLERAYKAYDQLEGQLHHARLSNKKAIRRARIAGVLGLVGLGLTAAGFFTNATKLAPKYLDVIDLLGLHDITADQGIDGWESKEDKVDTPPVTDETKAPTVTVVDDKKVKELEEQLAQYRAQEADYKKAQEQVAQLQKTLEDQKKTSDAEKEDLEGRLTARDQAVRDLQDKISRLSIDLQRYKTTADSRAAELEDIQKRMAATEEELKKKSAELAKTREKGIYITEAEYIRYEDLRVQCDDLRQKLRQERESYQKKWDAFTKVQDSLKEAQDKLILMLEAEKKKIDLMKKNHEERVQELMERLQQAGDPTAFAEYQKKVVANYEQQITDLKAQHKRELERLALEREEDLETVRREKDAELKTKLDQIIQERESALLVVNKPVEDLGPYLSRGISQSYVARFFGGHFEEQLTRTYGTSYRLFAVRQGERTFIKIICEDGTTDFRIVPEGNKKTFYSQIEAIRTHLKGISSALDDHLEKHGSLEITYSGTDIYGDIYRAVFEAEPTDGQIDDMRSVVQARVKPYVVEKLRKKLRPGKKVTLRLPKSD